jgi:hypothetical protein
MGGEATVGTDYTPTATVDDGGLVLTIVEVTVVFWGKYWSSTTSPPSPSSDEFYQAMTGIATGPYMTGMRQYRGVGPGTMLGKFIYDTTDIPQNFTDTDITNMLTDLFDNNSSVPPPLANHGRLYVTIAPPGISNADNLWGRHDSSSYNGTPFYYAWVGYNGGLNSTPGLVALFGHEVAEAATDPVLGKSFLVMGPPPADPTGDEIGDTCQFASNEILVQMNAIPCYVQGYWSAADNAGILPEGRLSFAVGKSTFGLDEVKEALKTSGGAFREAFYLFLDDFSKTTYESFIVNVPVPSSGTFANLSGVILQQGQGISNPYFEDPSNPDNLQRIRFSYDVIFQGQTNDPNTPITPFPSTGAKQYSLTATFTTNSVTVQTPPASMDFELVAGADPYFSSINPQDANSVWWLSRDLRVFSLSVGNSALPGDSSAPTFSGTSNIAGYAYIQSLLKYLNTSSTYTVPPVSGTSDTLDTLLQQNNADTAETSVTPVDNAGNPNFNFAIARVRLTSDGQGTAGQATNVRVFFRPWVAPSYDNDFDPNTTYSSDPPYPALPATPLASSATVPPDPSGQAIRTTPFYAIDGTGSNDYTPKPGTYNNIQTIEIPVGSTQDTVRAYYGCFLDVYNSNQGTYPGTHHCLVAQIAYDGAPLLYDSGTATNPGNTDKLTQRNLSIQPASGVLLGSVQGQIIQVAKPQATTQVAVPAAAAVLPTHRIATPFDTRPSPSPTFGPSVSISIVIHSRYTNSLTSSSRPYSIIPTLS